MTAKKEKGDWKQIQQRTFTNWFNDRLRGNLKVAKRQADNIQTDLQDGVLLVELLNILAKPRKIPRYNKTTKNKMQCMENLNTALRFIEKEGMKLVNIGAEDLYDGNLKLILGLIWTLIRHYQIKSSGKGLSTKQAMLLWINQQIPEYKIKNFTVNWNDGRALCALSNSIKTGLCPGHWTLDRSCGLANCELGLQIAYDTFGISMVLSAEDLNNPDVDELSVMTYLSYFCEPANNRLLEWIRSKIPHRDIQNLCTDWNDGSNLGALMDACFPDTCPEWVTMVPEQAVENLQSLMAKIEAKLEIVSPMKPEQMADPKVDEILVATYLAQFRNANLKLSPEGFSVFPPQLPSGVARVNIPVKFSIDTKGKPPPDSSFEVTAKGPTTEVAATITPADYGDYDVSFVPTEPGDFEVCTTFQGEPITGSPFNVPVIDVSNCRIVGDLPEQLQVGVTVELTIEAESAGSGVLEAYVESEEDEGSLVRTQISDMGGGSWCLLLDPVHIGEGTLHVMWSGEDVPRTPYDVAIFDCSKVRASGMPSEGKVGELVQFYILAHGAGLCLPKVTVNGPTSQCRCSVKERANGRWDMSFTPWEVGSHKVTILWGGCDISNSPITLEVAAASDASGCTASGVGLDKCIAKIPCEFVLTAPEDDCLETNSISVKVIGSECNGDVEMKSQGNGKYQVIYVCTVEGMYKIEVRFKEKNIPGSPFQVQCLPAPDASKCRAYGQCLHPNAILLAGSTVEMFVDTSKAGTGELAVVAKGKGGITPKIYMSDDGSGTYSVKFTPSSSGKFYIHVWWYGIHISKSPFQLRIFDGPDASKVKVSGPGVGREVEVGQPARFKIETENAGVGTLLIRVHGIKNAFDVEAKPISQDDPRTLTAHYNPTEGGDYRVTVHWSGVEVPGSPFRVCVIDPEREERREKRDKQKELKAKYSSENHTQTKSATMPASYVYPAQSPQYNMHLMENPTLTNFGTENPLNQSTPESQTMKNTKVSFKEEKVTKKSSK